MHFGGNVSVEKQQLGLALTSVRPTGIMGLGFSSNVAASRSYATIIENMVDQGFIDTAAFSLYLVSCLEAQSVEGGVADVVWC